MTAAIYTRICRACKRELPLPHFPFAASVRGNHCRECQKEAKRKRRLAERDLKLAARREARRAEKQGKGPSAVSPQAGSSGREPEAEKARRNRLKICYNIDLFQYEKLLDKQEGRCALCRRLPCNGRRLAVDHCHRTAKIRGLLCGRCNKALGLLGDDSASVLRAFVYLLRAESETVTANTNRRRGAVHIPRLCKRGEGFAYVTDPGSHKQYGLGPWGSDQAQRRYFAWVEQWAAAERRMLDDDPRQNRAE